MKFAVENIITDNLPIWSSAVQSKSSAGRGASSKRHLYGVKKLRELILNLAVRGLLVPQDPNDVSLNTLVESMIAKKNEADGNHVKKGKFDFSTPIHIEGSENQTPVNWGYFYLGSLVDILDSLRKPISRKDRVSGQYPYYGASGVVDYVNNFIFDEPLVLIGEDGAKWGKGEKTAFTISGKTWVNNHAHVVRPNRNIILDKFLTNSLMQQNLQKYITGITVPKLNQARLSSIIIPLPPLAEQHRIVAKVDELMALCDTLEQQQEDSIQAHETLVEVLLEALSNAVDANAFQASWERISEHFDALFTTEHSINKLKETILQLAVMGKLVPQNPSDEPASVLLEKIAAEKERLIKEGKIKKQKPLPNLTESEKLFSLPSNWSWTRAQDISTYIQRGKSPKYDEKGQVTVISQKCVQWNGLNLKPARTIDNDSLVAYQPERFLCDDDLLWNSTGTGTVGRIAVVLEVPLRTMVADSHVTVLRINKANKDYIKTYISSAFVQKRINPEHENSLVSGSTKQVELNTGSIINLPVPIPPLAEQHRIVAKANEMMALCDKLKNSLKQAQETQILLTDAVVENAL